MDIFNRKELELTVETLSNTNEFEISEVVELLEEVFSVSARQKFSKETVLSTKIKDDYNVELYRVYKMIGDNHEGLEENEKYSSDFHVYQDQVQELGQDDSNLKYGDKFFVLIEDFKTDRHVTNVAKQQLKVKISELNKKKVKESFLKNDHDLIPVIIKGFDKKGYNVELSSGHTGRLPKTNLFNQNERLKVGSRQLVMFDNENTSNTLIFKRQGDDFIYNVLAREIDDVYNEVINVNGICKIDGVKTVIAVHSSDKNIDPVGSCIGAKGVRINSVSKNLDGENFEVVKWSPEVVEMASNVIKENILQVVIEDKLCTIVVSDESISNAKGKNNYKVKALTKFLNMEISIIPESETSAEDDSLVEYFAQALNLDDDSASLIANSGFYSIDELLRTNAYDLSLNLDIDEDSALMLIDLSKEAVLKRDEYLESLNTDLFVVKEIDNYLAERLINANIKNREDLAELDSFELQEIIPIDSELAGEIILDARKVWDSEL